jgi:hypothetical protein
LRLRKKTKEDWQLLRLLNVIWKMTLLSNFI